MSETSAERAREPQSASSLGSTEVLAETVNSPTLASVSAGILQVTQHPPSQAQGVLPSTRTRDNPGPPSQGYPSLPAHFRLKPVVRRWLPTENWTRRKGRKQNQAKSRSRSTGPQAVWDLHRKAR